ncbi:hypothetical protein BDW75DRAFT_226468 [Aspergillus navahoensis]
MPQSRCVHIISTIANVTLRYVERSSGSFKYGLNCKRSEKYQKVISFVIVIFNRWELKLLLASAQHPVDKGRHTGVVCASWHPWCEPSQTSLEYISNSGCAQVTCRRCRHSVASERILVTLTSNGLRKFRLGHLTGKHPDHRLLALTGHRLQ